MLFSNLIIVLPPSDISIGFVSTAPPNELRIDAAGE
jgi:hypothetical protein